MEVLRFHYEVVLVANLLLDFVDGVAWKTRYDAVYECGANIAMIGEPGLESFVVLTKVVFPQFNILVDTLLQVMSV